MQGPVRTLIALPAQAATVEDLVRRLEDLSGVESHIEILDGAHVSAHTDSTYPHLRPGGTCLGLMAVFLGRAFPTVVDFVDRSSRHLKYPTVLSVEEGRVESLFVPRAKRKSSCCSIAGVLVAHASCHRLT